MLIARQNLENHRSIDKLLAIDVIRVNPRIELLNLALDSELDKDSTYKASINLEFDNISKKVP